ncbi:RsfA family transcriptional regulator [Cerasibacillus terrae]|uniref:RsfA family transcriptional regulator n=1 Tax=Cerasibacillus terrae TaxID=2498845 RepID=A0A5C8P2C7_9BACI|nr:RsfA family transcriptional regulator [Cerasibacillus terrae]TXL67588.1 RsfA family transcriptional regulator [Cerasibacillus terrae]
MYVTRQDAWTEEEDKILAETVLRYIRDGKTQLEAFKMVAEHLSRTSAACGFRWNATLRKKYQDAISLAKDARKKRTHHQYPVNEGIEKQQNSIEAAISLLEKMKMDYGMKHSEEEKTQKKDVVQLEQENNDLKEKITRYESAWKEMEKLWHWVHGDSELK